MAMLVDSSGDDTLLGTAPGVLIYQSYAGALPPMIGWDRSARPGAALLRVQQGRDLPWPR
jgi:hypothetical protein